MHRLLLLLTTMPVVWTESTVDGVQRKLIRDNKGRFRLQPGRVNRIDHLSTDADKRLQQLHKWLGNRESLPADLLAALQENPPNASSSEVATPVDHSPGVRAEHTNR